MKAIILTCVLGLLMTATPEEKNVDVLVLADNPFKYTTKLRFEPMIIETPEVDTFCVTRWVEQEVKVWAGDTSWITTTSVVPKEDTLFVPVIKLKYKDQWFKVQLTPIEENNAD